MLTSLASHYLLDICNIPGVLGIFKRLAAQHKKAETSALRNQRWDPALSLSLVRKFTYSMQGSREANEKG